MSLSLLLTLLFPDSSLGQCLQASVTLSYSFSNCWSTLSHNNHQPLCLANFYHIAPSVWLYCPNVDGIFGSWLTGWESWHAYLQLLSTLSSSSSVKSNDILFAKVGFIWYVCQLIFPQSLDNITPLFLKFNVADKSDLHIILLPSWETTLETTKLFSLNLSIWQIPVLCLYICIFF